MSRVMEMTRHVTSWLGWTPAAPCDGLPAEEEEEGPLQESSGFVTVLILYLGMAGLFAALNLCTGSAKQELAALERRQVQRLGRHGLSATRPALPPSWLVNLASLIRDVAAPRRPPILLQQQQQQRLRMRLLRQKEQELEMAMESEWQEQPTWQDVFDEEEPLAPGSAMPNHQKSTYFDLPSDSE
ncbi:uncharacterized protein LOC108035992 [Drosophila biarmipes]|uniref:uncharacterized protein LOC108035992 n=1 Tax=Drosophila biarmipes TaxID=125945 RepID=UPI0007E8096F|nr:uncharacterized protein LOC108035992 [Drosophila biarmipes]